MCRPGYEFARSLWFGNVLLREIFRLVVRYTLDPVNHALVNMNTGRNDPGASQIQPEAMLPFWFCLSRDGHGISAKLRPKFGDPPGALQRFMLILCQRVGGDVWRLAA